MEIMKLYFCFVGSKKVPENFRNYTVCESDEKRGVFNDWLNQHPEKSVLTISLSRLHI